MEEMKLFQMNTALVKRNIEYDCLVQRCRLGEQQQLDEIVALIVETISIERENMMDIQEQISTDRLSMHYWQRLKPEELEQ